MHSCLVFPPVLGSLWYTAAPGGTIGHHEARQFPTALGSLEGNRCYPHRSS